MSKIKISSLLIIKLIIYDSEIRLIHTKMIIEIIFKYFKENYSLTFENLKTMFFNE